MVRSTLLLLLTICIALSTPLNAAKESSGEVLHNDNDIPRELVIETAVKFGDGGAVLMLGSAQLGEKTYTEWDKVPVEEVLQFANGIPGVQYIPVSEADDFEHNVRTGASIRFTEPIEEILISREKGAEQDTAGPAGLALVHPQRVQKEGRPNPGRGIYRKFPFPGQPLVTRSLSMTQLKQIGVNIVGGRQLDNENYDCRAFAYQFILAVVPEQRARLLKGDIEQWPLNVRLEEQQFLGLGVRSMFAAYVPEFTYEGWFQKLHNGELDTNTDVIHAPE